MRPIGATDGVSLLLAESVGSEGRVQGTARDSRGFRALKVWLALRQVGLRLPANDRG